jgi:GMP synthase-like glutamine amidotransferase
MKTHTLFTILTLIVVLINPVNGKAFESVSLENWQFESYHLKYSDDWTASLIRSELTTADHAYASPSGNVVIKGYLANGRAELSSPSLPLKPFTWYEIEILYKTLGASDSSRALAGLYPASSRALMDQVILPSTNGSVRTHKALLHSGASSPDYHFFVGNTGIGETEFYSFRFRELAAYQVPDKKMMIVDLLKFEADPENMELWKSLNRFTSLFGFEDPAYVHPLKIKAGAMEKADPGIIVFTPTATDTESIKMGFLKKKKHKKGIEKILRYAEENRIPVLGICAGHQSVALHYGAFLARLKDDESGKYLKEIGPTTLNIVQEDPVFSHLPDQNKLKITEAHMIVVGYNFKMPDNLAISEDFGNQIFRYHHLEGVPWYTFQGHIEKDWEYACPEGSVVMNNLLSNWGLIQDRFSL